MNPKSEIHRLRGVYEAGCRLPEPWVDGYIECCDEVFGHLEGFTPLSLRQDLADLMGLSDEARKKYGL